MSNNRRFKLFFVKIGLILGSLVLLSMGSSIIWAASLNIPDFDAFFKERVISESTKIYDRTGDVLLYDVHGNIKRTVVPYDQISDHIKKATISIEDSNFYNHSGIQLSAMLRSLLVDISTGKIEQGGSTITQQVIKNVLLTKDKKISRKIKEIVLAVKLEQIMPKNDILALYLNETPYGGNIYGVEEAATSFFGKNASEVNLAEAAYLAALPQAPSYFSPYGNHKDKLEERKNVVLNRMAELGYITKDEAEKAKKEKVEFKPLDGKGIKAPHFVFYIIEQLEEKYGREAVETQGFKVITTLDWNLQKKAEEVVKKYGEENSAKYNAHNASMIATDPKTGQILVMVGSKDYFDTKNDGNFNISLAKRQPGSAFKPFVYATAFEKGYTPETVVFDLPTQFSTNCPPNCYTPENYDGKYLGPITFRNALAQSRNIPAVKALYLAGINDSLATAKRFGITSLNDPNRYGLTLVLGGGEVSLLELTSAYGVFANEGVRNNTISLIRVEDANGKVLNEEQPKSESVMNPAITRMISSILSDNNARIPAFGANSPLYFPNHQVAAKTGTTNDYRDAWIIGYTPNIAVGAWVGNNDNTPMDKKIAGFIVAPMWNEFMRSYLAEAPSENFQPAPVIDQNIKPILRGVWQQPSIHSILYWVDKNNPLGPTPSNPMNDPQFLLWEEPINIWKSVNNLN